ncbi:hypothetical protein EV183_004760 [Coemansia sp. RSA 2336]|nr:hypothetical protein EV183_004760 [Coemansia sp. RSA 2336]
MSAASAIKRYYAPHPSTGNLASAQPQRGKPMTPQEVLDKRHPKGQNEALSSIIDGELDYDTDMAWQNYRRKSTEGVSVTMLYLWFIGNMLYGAYAVADELYFGLIIQPQLFAFFTLVNILQVYWYAYKWRKKTLVAGLALCVAYAALHVGFWKADERAILNNNDGAVTFLGVLPAIFIAVGFFPEFYVCVKEQSVEMSNFFIMLDILGGVFSTVSLAFDHTFDYVASITYLVVVLLDIVLALMKLYYHIRGTQGRLHCDDSSSIDTQANTKKKHCLPI